MKDKIIVEGIDKVGRTTFCNTLKDKLLNTVKQEYQIIYCDNNNSHDYVYYKDLLMSNEYIIFDGFCYSQFVYFNKYDRQSSGMSLTDLLLLEDIILENKLDVYYVYTDYNNIFQNMQSDSRYGMYTIDYIKELDTKYKYLFDTLSIVDVKLQYLEYSAKNTLYTNRKIDVEKFNYNRLPYTIAVEFDGVIAKNAFPNINVAVPNYAVINKILSLQNKGVKFILWTRRDGSYLIDACNYCRRLGIVFDTVNSDIDEVRIPLHGNKKKVWANEYWDSHAQKIVF